MCLLFLSHLRRTVIILMGVGFCASGLFVPVHATKVASERIPIVETIQCALLGTDNGTLKFTIKANEMYYYDNGDVVLVGELEIVVFDLQTGVDAQEEEKTYIQARKLTYNKQEKLCTIEGNVRIQKPSEALKLYTEQVFYNTEKENLFTEMPVAIEHKKTLLKGNGLWATKDLKQYALKKPCGSMELEEPLGEGQ